MAHNAVLIGLLLFSSSVWVGSLVCLAVVAATARSSLEPTARVAFFRTLGRRYGMVGGAALAVSIGVGLTMGWPPSSWGRLEDTAVALTAALVAATAFGIRQARAMSRLRARHVADPSDATVAGRVRRGASAAAAARSLIGLLSLAVVAVTARIIGG